MSSRLCNGGAKTGDRAHAAQSAHPFLKWAGGKRWLVELIESYLPPSYSRYHEPFVGGGAVFFHLAPKAAHLSDLNPDLINAYEKVRDNVDAIVDRLSELQVNKKTYKCQKGLLSSNELDRATAFIYLNRTAFNGLYRVNKEGKFNVPFAGNQRRVLFDEQQIRMASALLQRCELRCRDFSVAIAEVKQGDLLYCDPPYTVRHNNNGFIRYNESLFSWDQQKQLATLAQDAVMRGAFVLVSNADHNPVRQLYRGFKAKRLSRASCMAGDPSGRGSTSECVFIGKPAVF